MAFSGKRALHGIANVGVTRTFTKKRGLHGETNVTVPVEFTGQRGLHGVANVPTYMIGGHIDALSTVSGYVSAPRRVAGTILATSTMSGHVAKLLPPPPNDDWANATVLDAPSGTLNDDNTGATPETPDPVADYADSSTTVWYKYTALADGTLTIFTSEHGGSPIEDTVLGVYTGDDLASLVEEAFNDDFATFYSRVSLSVTEGTTYYIEIAGYSGAEGTYSLTWSGPSPPVPPGAAAGTDIGEAWRELEPPGLSSPPWLLPVDDDTMWGEARGVFANYLQKMSDALYRWWLGLDMEHIVVDGTDDSELRNWEQMLGIPVNPVWTDDLRRTLLRIRWFKGPFTRARRNQIIELFLTAFLVTSSDIPIEFGLSGMLFTDDGVPFGVEAGALTGSYNVIEDIPGFSYQVRILDTYYTNGFDDSSLTRELERITPAPITLTIVSTPTP